MTGVRDVGLFCGMCARHRLILQVIAGWSSIAVAPSDGGAPTSSSEISHHGFSHTGEKRFKER
jgi:hypothetical protein